MDRVARQRPTEANAGAHLFLYDGECGLCSRMLRFLLQHDRRGVFRFAPLQGPTGKAIVRDAGANPHDLTSMYVVANYRTLAATVLTRSQAALFAAGELGWPWKIARAANVLPEGLLDRLYAFVARNRYSIFGRNDRCLAPTDEFRDRLVD
jgi:predicted DCC family thiol-disulfide oxidoreductase YuxK